MKLLNIRTFSGTTLAQLMRYASIDLAAFLKSVLAGHTRLTFGDNFESFEFQMASLAAGTSVDIPNRLKTTQLYWFPVRITGDNRLVETAVTNTVITLKNMGAVSVTATILMMRV